MRLTKRCFVLWLGVGLWCAVDPCVTACAQDDELSDVSGDLDSEDVDESRQGDATTDDVESESVALPNSEDGPAEDHSTSEPSARALRLRLGVGAGYGSLGYRRPIAVGQEVLPDTAFAAVGVSVALQLLPTDVLSFEVQAAYQTSIGMTLEIDPLFALPEQVSTRFQYFEAGVTPVLRLSESLDGLAFALPLSLGIRSFAPRVREYSIERFQLGGPQAGLEARVALGDLVSLRIGPQAQWVLMIKSGLADRGACCQGLTIGGQGLLEAKIGSVLRAQLSYRQAHTFVPIATLGFRSVERFLMARLAGEI